VVSFHVGAVVPLVPAVVASCTFPDGSRISFPRVYTLEGFHTGNNDETMKPEWAVTIGTREKGAMLVEVRVPAGSATEPWINITLPCTANVPSTSAMSTPTEGCTNMIVILCALIAVGCPVRPDVTVPVI
jgi:hypothetical protein